MCDLPQGRVGEGRRRGGGEAGGGGEPGAGGGEARVIARGLT